MCLTITFGSRAAVEEEEEEEVEVEEEVEEEEVEEEEVEKEEEVKEIEEAEVEVVLCVFLTDGDSGDGGGCELMLCHPC